MVNLVIAGNETQCEISNSKHWVYLKLKMAYANLNLLKLIFLSLSIQIIPIATVLYSEGAEQLSLLFTRCTACVLIG